MRQSDASNSIANDANSIAQEQYGLAVNVASRPLNQPPESPQMLADGRMAYGGKIWDLTTTKATATENSATPRPRIDRIGAANSATFTSDRPAMA